MDVVLGVAVADRVARLTLVEAAAHDPEVIDQSVVDLADNPIQTLTDTVVGTNRLLADENHRLSATRLSWSDPQSVDELRQALEDSGVQNVVVLDEPEAPTAMAPTVGLDGAATAMAPAVGDTQSTGQVGSQWAYSAAEAEPLNEAGADAGPVRRLAAADVFLGVAVAGTIARLALVGPAAGGYAAIEHLVVDLGVNPFETLTRAVVDTQRALANEGRHLVASRLYSPDPAQAQALSQALAGAGVGNVAVSSEAEAVTALLRGILGGGAPPGSLVLQVTAEAATLLGLGAADALATVLATVALADVVDVAAAVVDMVLDFLRTAPFDVAAAFVMGTFEDLAGVLEQLRARLPLPAELLDHPEFALASGAAAAPAVAAATHDAMDATAMAPALGAAGDATAIAPTVGLAESQAEESQLAYSMTEDGEPLPVEGEFGPDYPEYYDDEEAHTTAQRLSGRSLLISNAVVAFAVIGFASLAVAVAITVRPTAAAEPVVGHQNAAPGKFMPLLPTQQQAPVPAPPADQPNAGYQGGIIPDYNGYIPPQLISPGERCLLRFPGRRAFPAWCPTRTGRSPSRSSFRTRAGGRGIRRIGRRRRRPPHAAVHTPTSPPPRPAENAGDTVHSVHAATPSAPTTPSTPVHAVDALRRRLRPRRRPHRRRPRLPVHRGRAAADDSKRAGQLAASAVEPPQPHRRWRRRTSRRRRARPRSRPARSRRARRQRPPLTAHARSRHGGAAVPQRGGVAAGGAGGDSRRLSRAGGRQQQHR